MAMVTVINSHSLEKHTHKRKGAPTQEGARIRHSFVHTCKGAIKTLN